MEKQKLNIIKALSRPRDKLFISYIDDGSAQRSPVLERISGVLEGLRTNRMADIAPVLARNAVELTAKSVRGAADGSAEPCPAPGAVAAVLYGGFEDEIIKLEKALAQSNEAASVAGLAEGLYGSYQLSAKRVESFYGCPYRHFLGFGIRAEQMREYSVDPLDIGIFAHDVMDLTAKRIQGAGWDRISEAELRTAVHACAETAARGDTRYRLNARNEAVISAVTEELALTAEMIRRQSRSGALKPYRSEYEFRLADPPMTGKIDRIDTAATDSGRYFSIVDYKTGGDDFDINRMAEGVNLQMILYVIAVRALLGDKYAFAGANYLRIYGALRDREKPLDPLFRMCGIEGVSRGAAETLFGRGDGKGALFSVTFSKERCYTEQEMDVLAAWAINLLRQADRRIKDGDTDICPAKYGDKLIACALCAFGDICGFESGTDITRTIEKSGKDARIAIMRQALEDADGNDV